MIGAVVVLYNPNADEINNLCIYMKYSDYLVIVDNSDVSNIDVIKSTLGDSNKYHIIDNRCNLGLCKALNQGFSYLSNIQCEWVVAFDADSKITDNIFEVYRKIIKNFDNVDNVAVFAPQHSYLRNKVKLYNGIKKIDWAMTSGCLFNVKIFNICGGFYEPLFVDGLDVDYCLYAKEKKYDIFECGQVIIKHNPAINVEKRVCGFKINYGIASPYRYYLQSRSLVWIIFRYKSFWAIKMFIIKLAKVLLLFPNKINYLSSYLKGIVDGLKLFFNRTR